MYATRTRPRTVQPQHETTTDKEVIQNLRKEVEEKNKTIEKLTEELEQIRKKDEKVTETVIISSSETTTIDIIGKNIREFGRLAFDNGHQLITKHETREELCVLMKPLNESSNLKNAMEKINNLLEELKETAFSSLPDIPEQVDLTPELLTFIDNQAELIKKQEEQIGVFEEEVTVLKHTNRELRKIKNDLEVQMKQDDGNSISLLKEQIETKEALINCHQLTKQLEVQNTDYRATNAELIRLIKLKDEQLEALKKNQGKLDEKEDIRKKLEKRMADIQSSSRQTRDSFSKVSEHLRADSVERERKERKQICSIKLQHFFSQKDFQFIKNSSEIMDKLCERLSQRQDNGPLMNIQSHSEKKKILSSFIDLSHETRALSEIEKHIFTWFQSNSNSFLHSPTLQEKMEQKRKFNEKLHVNDVIGTVYYNTLKSNIDEIYICLIVVNCKIIYWTRASTKAECLRNAAKFFESNQWNNSNKIAVPGLPYDISGPFIETTNSDVYKTNERVRQWMSNNVRKWNSRCFSAAPALFNLSMKYLEELYC